MKKPNRYSYIKFLNTYYRWETLRYHKYADRFIIWSENYPGSLIHDVHNFPCINKL